MKLEALIVKTVELHHKHITVEFEKDPLKQKFEVFFECERAYDLGFRIFGRYILDIKWKSRDVLINNEVRSETYFEGKVVRTVSTWTKKQKKK